MWGSLGFFASDHGPTVLAINCGGFSFYCRHSLDALGDVKVFLLGFGLICKMRLFSRNGLNPVSITTFPR